MSISNYLSQKLLNHVLNGPLTSNPVSPFAQPNATYIGLFNVMPDNLSQPGVEVHGGGYSRVFCNFLTTYPAKNKADLIFNTATSNWGVVKGYGLWDAETSGNLLFFNTFNANADINIGGILRIPREELIISAI